MIEKIPPQNLEIERSLLAGCLLSADILDTVTDQVNLFDFYRQTHQTIFKAILGLVDEGEPVDLLTINARLQTANALDAVGGSAYLSVIVDMPIPLSPDSLCAQLRDMAILRRLILTCTTLIQDCYNNPIALEMVDRAQQQIMAIGENGNDDCITMRDLTVQSQERYDKLYANKDHKRINTGFYELDSLIGGLRGGKFVVIGARPRIGKTSIALTMARYMAERDTMVGFIELEMDKEDLDDRWLSSITGINVLKLQSCQHLRKEEWGVIVEQSAIKSDWPIIVNDAGGMTIAAVKRVARRMKKMGCKIIFIDQLSKIIGNRRKSKYEETTEIVNDIDGLKKELRMPIILLAQINRQATARKDQVPMIEDLKNTGAIEEDTDIVLILHRASVYNAEEDPTLAQLEIAKCRGGPEKTIYLHWDGKTTTFSNPKQ